MKALRQTASAPSKPPLQALLTSVLRPWSRQSGDGALLLEFSGVTAACIGSLPVNEGDDGPFRVLTGQKNNGRLATREGETAAKLWADSAGAPDHDEEEKWCDPLFHVYYLANGQCRVVARRGDGTVVIHDGATMEVLFHLDLQDEPPGAHSVLWPLDVAVACVQGEEPRVILMLGECPLTQTQRRQRIKRLAPRDPRVRVYDGSTGEILRNLHNDHLTSIAHCALLPTVESGPLLATVYEEYIQVMIRHP
jgi:hypothetical protein